MRLELAKLFLLSPSLYILDEPTNHLDLPSMIFVEDFLKNSGSTTIFVSHDKGLLDRLSSDIVHLSFGNLKHYPGNYSNFLIKEKEEQALALKNIESLNAKIDELQRFVDRFGAKATKAKQAQSKAKQIEKLKEQRQNIIVAQGEKSIAIPLPKLEKAIEMY